jgi:hypothetical protein
LTSEELARRAAKVCSCGHKLVVLVAAALLLVACGGGDDAEDEPTSVGLGVEDPATTTSAPTTPQTTVSVSPAPTAPAVTPAPGPVVANRADRDIEGWRLSIVVADKTTFGPDESMTLELTFANISDETLHTDSAQNLHFGIVDGSGEFVWTDQACGGTAADMPDESHVALELGPGESGRFVERYPTSDPGGAQCRLPPGRYGVVGQLDWCPPESLQHYEGRSSVCDPAAVQPLLSAPVAVEITA